MIFKFHYGLWYGALVGIIPFMFNYAVEYSGATGKQHGILYTILPFVALIAKPIVCSIADKYAAHHHCLLFFIATTILGYGSLAIYPFFPNLIQNHKQLVWALYCIAALVGNTSMCIVNSIGDSLAVNSCQKKDISYGQYRLWGPVGFGIFGALWGVANEIPSMPKYTPGILTLVVILIINSLLIAFWYDRDEFKVIRRIISRSSSPNSHQHQGETNSLTNPNYGSTEVVIEQPQQPNSINDGGDVVTNRSSSSNSDDGPKIGRLALLWRLGRQQSSIYAYIFLFTFCGLMTGIHWQFFFRYLEQMSIESKQSFSTIATLALPVQALGGELVFFMLASAILRKLGSSLVLVICLFSFAARYLLYAYLIPSVSLYWILLVELLQGPAFGLMYCVLTHQANYYSEKIDEIVASSSMRSDTKYKNSLHATLQGFLGASFEGLGLGLGALIGGLAYDINPILMWQIAGFSALAVSIICLIIAAVKPEESSLSDRTASHDLNNGLASDNNGEGQILEELRRIAKSCQSEDQRPSISQIKADLERLAKKYPVKNGRKENGTD